MIAFSAASLDDQLSSLVRAPHEYHSATLFDVRAQNGRHFQRPPHNNGHGWDIRLAVPGEPGNDYPTLATIPRTRFSCAGREPGYYADVDTNCQVFRVCTVGATYGFTSFLCPNGTLFNQAVFVCDWWMNVNCKKSDELLIKNDQFENLKLGPQLMKDIKKMLTHPVRNPLNTNAVKSKLLVMQNYKPPSGQLFPNGALLAPPEKAPSHIYIPTKAIQIALEQNEYKIPSQSFSASTPVPQYISPTFNPLTTLGNEEILSRQNLINQNGPNESEKMLTLQNNLNRHNGHTGHLPLVRNNNHINNAGNQQKTRKLENYINPQNILRNQQFNKVNVLNSGRNPSQSVRNNEYVEGRTNQDKITSTGTKSFYQDDQNNILNPVHLPPFTNKPQKGDKLNQNMGSTDIVPPTVLTKTVAYSRLIKEPEEQSPKSRITFKTWVLKPTKNLKLSANPTSYTYDQPINSISKVVNLESSYNYNKAITNENISGPKFEGYDYNKPTTSSIETDNEQEISPLHLSPTILNNGVTEPLLSTTTPQPTKPSSSYFATKIFKAAQRYLPPLEVSSTVSNQYLIPNASLRKLSRYQNSQLLTPPTSTTTEYTTSSTIDNINLPKRNQQSNIKFKTNNLSFSDILSKENLDITINEIVNDTKLITKSTLPINFNEYFIKINPELSNNIPSEYDKEDKEDLTKQSSFLPKPAKQIARPSLELQPPIETFVNNSNVNRLSSLPFLKETLLPTIERTVSIKITIPESIANVFFKTNNDAEIEIINTDDRNYMVFQNANIKDTEASIPIGKLSWYDKSNLSTSQALVFSLLADTLNTAKKYNNIIRENIISPTPLPPVKLQVVNNREFGEISKTFPQFPNKDGYKSSNSPLSSEQVNTYTTKELNDRNKNKFEKYHTPKLPVSLASEAQNSNTNLIDNSKTNQQTYSGQLYKFSVPEVTQQIINAPSLANANIISESEKDEIKSRRVVNPKNSAMKTLDSSTEIDKNVEILQIPKSPTISGIFKLTTTETPLFKTQDNNALINKLNSRSSITAQIKDKISGTIPYPTEGNKFITYKKDQTYYLYSNIDNDNLSNDQNKLKKIGNNMYPDLITFHFIPSEKQNLNDKLVLQTDSQNYQLNQNNFEKTGDYLETFNNNFKDELHTNHIGLNTINSASRKQKEDINTLYDGPSSYLSPQLSIGNLMPTTEGLEDTYNSKIEDLDEDNNLTGYPKEKPSPQFTFK
ncbi:GATA zinc finger domain-containing protein 7-like [Battus philenor]|uniref:GATA zinc finger domain-containing protein 7-like n=1 Tax=Battus philenor TaxID=42288 RepID=UPI0035CF93FF